MYALDGNYIYGEACGCLRAEKLRKQLLLYLMNLSVHNRQSRFQRYHLLYVSVVDVRQKQGPVPPGQVNICIERDRFLLIAE